MFPAVAHLGEAVWGILYLSLQSGDKTLPHPLPPALGMLHPTALLRTATHDDSKGRQIRSLLFHF